MKIALSTNNLPTLLNRLSRFTKKSSKSMMHVVSANPENMVLAFYDSKFRKIYENCEEVITDGIGVFYFARIQGVPVTRITGVDALDHIVSFYNSALTAPVNNAKVLFVGGAHGVGEKVADILSKKYKNSVFETYRLPIFNTDKAYQLDLDFANFVKEYKPNLVFISLGSPKQEIFIETHRAFLPACICVGVGGAFDMIANDHSRAPKVLRNYGFEWLWRLIREPWRARRQLSLITFVFLVITKKLRFIRR